MKHLTFKEIFASMAYYNAEFTLIKTLIWLLIAVIIIYLFYLIYSKFLFKTKKQKMDNYTSDIRLRLSLLWAIVSFMVVFAILIIVLLYYVNFDTINWGDYKIYLAFFKNQSQSFFPYLVTFISVIIYYYIKNSNFRKQIKSI